MGSSDRRLSQDTAFDILSSPRRRYVLYYLRQTDEPVDLTNLAEHVAAWENETDPDSLTDQQRKRVYVSLYQTHIPKLDDAGVVSYDGDAGTVELAPGATRIDEYLTQSENGPPWQAIYFAEVIVGAVALVLTIYGAFGPVSEALVGLLVVVTFALTTVAQYLYQRRTRTIPPELRRQS
jgi:hypothetical protein